MSNLCSISNLNRSKRNSKRNRLKQHLWLAWLLTQSVKINKIICILSHSKSRILLVRETSSKSWTRNLYKSVRNSSQWLSMRQVPKTTTITTRPSKMTKIKRQIKNRWSWNASLKSKWLLRRENSKDSLKICQPVSPSKWIVLKRWCPMPWKM